MARNINVHSNFRVNSLSLTPGGSTVTVIKNDGTRLKYDKVKNPQSYIDKVCENNNDIAGFEVNGEPVKNYRGCPGIS